MFERWFNCLYNFPGIQDRYGNFPELDLSRRRGVFIYSLPQSIVDWKPWAVVVPFLPWYKCSACKNSYIRSKGNSANFSSWTEQMQLLLSSLKLVTTTLAGYFTPLKIPNIELLPKIIFSHSCILEEMFLSFSVNRFLCWDDDLSWRRFVEEMVEPAQPIRGQDCTRWPIRAQLCLDYKLSGWLLS